MARIKHNSKHFNNGERTFAPGEVFEVPDENVEYLCSEHGCVMDGADVVSDMEPEPTEELISKGSGWYIWRGEQYRKSQLPDEAKALLE